MLLACELEARVLRTWQSLLEDTTSSSWNGFTRLCQTQCECRPPSSFTGSAAASAPRPSFRVSQIRTLQSSPPVTSCIEGGEREQGRHIWCNEVGESSSILICQQTPPTSAFSL